MFEYITIRQQNALRTGSPLDLGFLAEAMLFYRKVRVIADREVLRHLMVSLGPDLLLEYLEEGFLEITYVENYPALLFRGIGSPLESYEIMTWAPPFYSLSEYGPELLQKVTGKQERGRPLWNRMEKLIQAYSYGEDVVVQTCQDFADAEYVVSAVKQILDAYAPRYRLPDPLEFDITQETVDRLSFDLTPETVVFSVSTNIDFDAANESYRKQIPLDSRTMSEGYFLSLLINVSSHMFFASTVSSELAVDSVSSSLLELKISKVLERRAKSAAELELFQNIVLDDTRAVQEAINGRQHSFDDLIDVLRNAKKFKGWLAGQNPEKGLLKAYYQETTKGSWIDKLPGKSTRWSIFTFGGLALGAAVAGPFGAAAGTAAGILLTAGDTFLLDQLAKGWNPSSFVNRELEPFAGE